MSLQFPHQHASEVEALLNRAKYRDLTTEEKLLFATMAVAQSNLAVASAIQQLGSELGTIIGLLENISFRLEGIRQTMTHG